MSRDTTYAVQPFVRHEGDLVPDQPVPARDRAHALALARLLGKQKGGAIAFSREGDIDEGVYEDPVILLSVGDVPDDLTEMMVG